MPLSWSWRDESEKANLIERFTFVFFFLFRRIKNNELVQCTYKDTKATPVKELRNTQTFDYAKPDEVMLNHCSRSFCTDTNVIPIIRTHNILTSHNWTHNNPLEPIKKLLYYYGFVSHNVRSENNYGNFVRWFYEIDAIIGGIIFFMGLLITFYIQWQRQHHFGATVEEKTRASWHQVHKQGLHTIQMSAWDIWSEISSVKTQT